MIETFFYVINEILLSEKVLEHDLWKAHHFQFFA